jgi:hypothetical protein
MYSVREVDCGTRNQHCALAILPPFWAWWCQPATNAVKFDCPSKTWCSCARPRDWSPSGFRPAASTSHCEPWPSACPTEPRWPVCACLARARRWSSTTATSAGMRCVGANPVRLRPAFRQRARGQRHAACPEANRPRHTTGTPSTVNELYAGRVPWRNLSRGSASRLPKHPGTRAGVRRRAREPGPDAA